MGQNIAKSDRGPDKKGKLYHICGGFMEKVSYVCMVSHSAVSNSL